MSKLTWVDAKYGSTSKAVVAAGLSLEITPCGVATIYGPPLPYIVHVFGIAVIRRIFDRQEAKDVAERVALGLLQKAIAKFE